MIKFNIELADTVIGIEALHENSRDLCRDYLTERPSELCITLTEDDIEKERRFAASEDPSIQSLEYTALYRKICTELAGRDTVMIHGSCIAVDGQAYLFCAPSGTGKSTHTGLWRRYLGERAVMINDDKPLLRAGDCSVTVYGTPWNGKHHLGSNISAPLRAVCFLDRGTTNAIRKLNAKDGLPLLLKYTYRPERPEKMFSVLDSATKIAGLCDFWSLECDISEEAAATSYAAMSAQ